MSASVYQGLQSHLEPRIVEPQCVLRLKLAPIPFPNIPQSSSSYHFNPSPSLFSSDPAPSDKHNSASVLSKHENVSSTISINSTYQRNMESKAHFEGFHHDGKSNRNDDLGGCSFLEVLTNSSNNTSRTPPSDGKTNNCNNDHGNQVYVHPMVKRSASKLSDKSLEMCTESLGSETGSNVSDIGEEFSTFLSENVSDKIIPSSAREPSYEFGTSSKKSIINRRVSCSFPPPLTTIRNSDYSVSVQVKPHREDGRLVIKAVSQVNASQSCFKAERIDGRLKLHFLNNIPSADSSDMGHEEEAEIDDEEMDDFVDGDDADDCDKVSATRQVDEEDELIMDVDDDGYNEDKINDSDNAEDIEGNNEVVGVEIERLGRKLHRTNLCCTCKESGNRETANFVNWEPCCWVATS